MSANLDFIRTLEVYLGKECKIVYRDGGTNSPAKAFYGKLLGFDSKFSTWEGKNDPREKERFRVNFNHDDVSRIVVTMGGGASA